MWAISLSGCRWKGLSLERCRLTGANLFRTSLGGLDLSSCQLEGLILSERGDELRGAVVGLAQAAQLAKRLGIIIKEEQERPPERP